MKPNVTYVDAAKIELLLAKHGLDYVPQKGFNKVEPQPGAKIYVAATKNVGRLDVAFEAPEHLKGDLQEPHCGRFGAIRCQLRFDRPEAEVLEAIDRLLAHLKTMGPQPKPARRPATKKEGGPVGWSKTAPAKEAPAQPAA